MIGGSLDVPAEVKLIDLPEGDDVDPGDVAAAHLAREHGDYCTDTGSRSLRENVNSR